MLTNKSRLFEKKSKNNLKRPALGSAPQKRGVVTRPRIVTPRKPNSAKRQVVKLRLSNSKDTIAYIPGIGHNLRKHSKVLIRGGGARDLPNVNYRCCRGKYDFYGIYNKRRRRSIYGTERPESMVKKLRRKFRTR